MKGNFVFDLDGTLTIVSASYRAAEEEKEIRDAFGDEFTDRHCIEAYGVPHYVLPGYYALFQWLHKQGATIMFFSSGIEERNVEFVHKAMERSLGEKAKELDIKVYSRQHCIDTSMMSREEGKKYQSYYFGQRKKKLEGVVVPKEEVPHTLLIDDDISYMTKGEEYNLIVLKYCYKYLVEHPRKDDFMKFHSAYYLTGLFAEMQEYREKTNCTLVEAAKHLQIDIEEGELGRDFYYPGIARFKYYIKGLEILKKFDPSLKYYYEIPEEMQNEPDKAHDY